MKKTKQRLKKPYKQRSKEPCKRGRPSYSIVRERLKHLLLHKRSMTAYTAHKHYTTIFGHATRRNIYYQLRRGEEKNTFTSQEVEEQGEYSWGTSTRKVYYTLSKGRKKIDNNTKEKVEKYFKNIEE